MSTFRKLKEGDCLPETGTQSLGRIEIDPRAKLHPEVKTKWLKALRSGEYRQGQHNLEKKWSILLPRCYV